MNYKLIILLALVGCWSVASQTITSESGSTAGTEESSAAKTEPADTAETGTSSAGTTESANTAGTGTSSAATTESANTAGTGSSNAAKTESENTAGTEAPSATTKAPGGRNPAVPPFPPRRPQQPRPNGIPRLPIISDIIDSVQNRAQSILPLPGNGRRPGPGNRGRPGPPRIPRSVQFEMVLNFSKIHDFLNGENLPGLPDVPDMSNFELPDVDEIVPEVPESSDPSDLEIPEISKLPMLPPMPGLRAAIAQARKQVMEAINPEQDLTGGINVAIEIGLSSSDPTEAMRDLVSTVLQAYLKCARKCPLLIVGGFVMREGLYLASDILRVIADVSAQIQGVE